MSKNTVSMRAILAGLLLGAIPVLLTQRGLLPISYGRSELAESLLCERVNYTIEMVSLNPLMIYINGFVTIEEANYLAELGEHHYNGYRVVLGGLKEYSPKSGLLPKSDPRVACIGQRAIDFAGFLDHDDYDHPWFVKYNQSQELKTHYDPHPEGFSDENGRSYNKASTFFIYLDSNCTGGETYFPFIDSSRTPTNATKYYRGDNGKGLMIKPIQGNAVFWTNFKANGNLNPRAMHTGLPVINGTKSAVNIFMKKWLEDTGVSSSKFGTDQVAGAVKYI